MVDFPTVCCMCGDIGFPDKLFRCCRCQSRFQHSYCTSYYDEAAIAGLCDWCQSEERSAGHHSKRSAGKEAGGATSVRTEYAGDHKGKHKEREESSDRGKNMRGTPSPRPAGRRYKLLKDVLC